MATGFWFPWGSEIATHKHAITPVFPISLLPLIRQTSSWLEVGVTVTA